MARPSMTNASIRRTGQPVSWSHQEHSSLSTRGARRGWWSRGHHHRAGLDGQGAAAMNTTSSLPSAPAGAVYIGTHRQLADAADPTSRRGDGTPAGGVRADAHRNL